MALSIELSRDGLGHAHESSLVPLLELAAGKGWLVVKSRKSIWIGQSGIVIHCKLLSGVSDCSLNSATSCSPRVDDSIVEAASDSTVLIRCVNVEDGPGFGISQVPAGGHRTIDIRSSIKLMES